jgi:hypothetical protein
MASTRISPAPFRGTPKGEIRALVSEAFARMIDDLSRLEETGYGEDVCARVKSAITSIHDASMEKSGSRWVAGIAAVSGDFYTTYEKWNGQEQNVTRDAIISRRLEIREMQEFNNRMSLSFRKNHRARTVISRAEAEFCDVAFARLNELAALWPEYFKSLKTALRNRRRRTKRAR